MTRIMVTNDDGMSSTGLHVLARAMRAHGDVVIIAPDSEYSGAGAALGALHLIQPQAKRTTIDGIDEAWCINGTPALCTMFARFGIFGPIDLVVSGINPGANVGRSIYHSGTVGAALTGGSNGARGLAVSLDVGMHPATHEWGVAAQITRGVLRSLLDCPGGTVLNLNVPNDGAAGDRAPREATLAPFGIVQTTATEAGEGEVRLTVADLEGAHDPQTDAALLEAGHPTLTAITAVGETPLPDGVHMASERSTTA